jgi:hypothetical protein
VFADVSYSQLPNAQWTPAVATAVRGALAGAKVVAGVNAAKGSPSGQRPRSQQQPGGGGGRGSGGKKKKKTGKKKKR